jgi:anti-sigma factor RsiW
MSLCESIDTLAMAYLDDELAPEERRELELHAGECASCRAHLDDERADLDLIRTSLPAPRAPDVLRARVARVLDADDAAAHHATRRRYANWLLPGASLAVAAAALVVFVGGVGSGDRAGAAINEAVRQQTKQLPLEVQGASTGPWLRQHVAPSFEPPRFSEPGVHLRGARATALAGHDATQLVYDIDGMYRLDAIVMFDVKPDRDALGRELATGDDVQVGDRTLHLVEANGRYALTYIDPERHVGYAFIAPALTPDQLVRFVVSSDLVTRAQRDR